MLKKAIITLLVLFASILLFWFINKIKTDIDSLDEVGKPKFEIKHIDFPNKNTKIYLKSKNWGLTGDHKISVISTNPVYEFHPDSLSEYIFEGFEEIIFYAEKDTLKIFSKQTPKMPKKFDSEIKIKIIEINNNKEWNEIKEKDGYQIFE
jgi:hypothetical protein